MIDTPGLDVDNYKGPEYDNQIMKKYHDFLKQNVKKLDYVLFVIKASETRFDLGVEYAYRKIVTLLGESIKERIIVMFTFADGGKPLA